MPRLPSISLSRSAPHYVLLSGRGSVGGVIGNYLPLSIEKGVCFRKQPIIVMWPTTEIARALQPTGDNCSLAEEVYLDIGCLITGESHLDGFPQVQEVSFGEERHLRDDDGQFRSPQAIQGLHVAAEMGVVPVRLEFQDLRDLIRSTFLCHGQVGRKNDKQERSKKEFHADTHSNLLTTQHQFFGNLAGRFLAKPQLHVRTN